MSLVPLSKLVASASTVTISNLDGDSFVYPEQSGVTLIDQGDAASVNAESFTGIVLTASISGMSSTQVLSVRHQGAEAGQIGFENGLITFGGVEIGEATGGDGEPLTIVLSTDNADAVTALLRNLNYADIGDAPEALSEVTIDLSDDNGVLASAVVTVNAVREGDLPVAENDDFALAVGDVVSSLLTSNDFDPDDPDAGILHVVSLTDATGTEHLIPSRFP